MSASKAWICCPLDLKATSRVKRETGIVSDAMYMQPAHTAQNVPGEESNPQPHNPSRLSMIFLPALPCALPAPPPAAYLPEDWLPFSRRECENVLVTHSESCFPPCGQKQLHNCSHPATEGWAGKEVYVWGRRNLLLLFPISLGSSLPLRTHALLSGCPSKPSTCFLQLHSKWAEDVILPESNSKGKKQKWPVPWVT